jgi:oligo-1,6-glucosidase/alpha-glucosidase
MLDFKFTAEYFHALIHHMEQQYPSPFMPVYVFSNHDQRRSMTRLRGDFRKAKLLHMLQLTVRGVPCMYYGEEIGMMDAKFPFGTALDPIPHKYKFIPRFVFNVLGLTVNRDEVRTPMQWNKNRNAGFSSAEGTWLPVHENYQQINVEAEGQDPASLFNTIRSMLEIRAREKALQEGSLAFIDGLPQNVLGYTRSTDMEKLLILLNFDEQEKEYQAEARDCIFKMTQGNRWNGKTLQLEGYGAVILKQ